MSLMNESSINSINSISLCEISQAGRIVHLHDLPIDYLPAMMHGSFDNFLGINRQLILPGRTISFILLIINHNSSSRCCCWGYDIYRNNNDEACLINPFM